MENKKKYFLILLGVLLLGIIIALGIATITGGSVKAIKGAEGVLYPIYLDNNESVAGFQIDIDYSTYLIYQGIEETSRMLNATIVVNDETDGFLSIAILIEDGIDFGDGEAFNLIFDVDESAIAGNYTIDLSDFVAANINATALEINVFDGNFEIVEPYGFEFLPPISNFENFTLQDGATLPLKFNVTDSSGFVVDNSVLVRVYNLSLGIDHTYNASGQGDDYIQINSTEGLYIVNIHTGSSGLDMPIGIYNIDVSFDNYQMELIGFELLEKGSNGKGKGKQR